MWHNIYYTRWITCHILTNVQIENQLNQDPRREGMRHRTKVFFVHDITLFSGTKRCRTYCSHFSWNFELAAQYSTTCARFNLRQNNPLRCYRTINYTQNNLPHSSKKQSGPYLITYHDRFLFHSTLNTKYPHNLMQRRYFATNMNTLRRHTEFVTG